VIAHDRLAAAVTELAARAEPADVRAQLHALAGIVANLGAPPVVGDDALVAGDDSLVAGDDSLADGDDSLARALEAAIAAGDEPAAVAAMRDLARRDRARVRRIDWTAASRG